MTVPTGKPRGLLGAVPQAVQPHSQNIQRGIEISVNLKPTTGTLMQTNGQVFLNYSMTLAAVLRCTTWINFNIRSTSLFRFVTRIVRKLVPRGIGNAFRQTVVADHPCDAQVLKDDNAKLIHQAAAEFMRKVFTPIGDPFVDMRNGLAPFTTFGRPLFSLRQAALRLHQRPRPVGTRLVEETRIGDLWDDGRSCGYARSWTRQARIHQP